MRAMPTASTEVATRAPVAFVAIEPGARPTPAARRLCIATRRAWWDGRVNEPSTALSVSIVGTPDLPGEALTALYRTTGRSTVELRRAIAVAEPVFVAELFGPDHIDVVPRLEKTITLLEQLGLAIAIHELTDGQPEAISLQTMREIIDGPTTD